MFHLLGIDQTPGLGEAVAVTSVQSAFHTFFITTVEVKRGGGETG